MILKVVSGRKFKPTENHTVKPPLKEHHSAYRTLVVIVRWFYYRVDKRSKIRKPVCKYVVVKRVGRNFGVVFRTGVTIYCFTK